MNPIRRRQAALGVRLDLPWLRVDKPGRDAAPAISARSDTHLLCRGWVVRKWGVFGVWMAVMWRSGGVLE